MAKPETIRINLAIEPTWNGPLHDALSRVPRGHMRAKYLKLLAERGLAGAAPDAMADLVVLQNAKDNEVLQKARIAGGEEGGGDSPPPRAARPKEATKTAATPKKPPRDAEPQVETPAGVSPEITFELDQPEPRGSLDLFNLGGLKVY